MLGCVLMTLRPMARFTFLSGLAGHVGPEGDELTCGVMLLPLALPGYRVRLGRVSC